MKKNGYILLLLPAMLFALTACGGEGEKGAEGAGADGRNIVETGTLEAVRTRAFSTPRLRYNSGQMRLVGLVEHGTMVKAGDSLIQLDPSGINKYILDRTTNLENEIAAREKLIVTNDNKIKSLESSVQSEQASFDLKKIEVESTAFESERTKRIKQLEFEQAKINLAQNQRRLELAHIMNDNDMKIQNIRLAQIENDIKSAALEKDKCTIRTSVNGVFQRGMSYQNWGQTLTVGENVYINQPLGNVPELEHMKVVTFINENDFLKIRQGQKVAVRLDATPSIVFDGEIAYIGKLCHPRDGAAGSRQKVFDVEVDILKPDERLKPGMTVSCEFLAGS